MFQVKDIIEEEQMKAMLKAREDSEVVIKRKPSLNAV